MLRYASAFAIALLLSLAFADSVDPSRDANLAYVDGFCLLVHLDANSSSTYGTAESTDKTIDMLAHIRAAEIEITGDLADKAALYGLPARSDCKEDELRTMPLVILHLQVVGSALSYNLRVLLPKSSAGFAYPAIWSEAGLLSRPTGVIPQDVKDQAAKAFDDFALAWKKQHAQ